MDVTADLGNDWSQSPSDERSQRTSFKRRRTAIACESCRKRKTRCTGGRPVCDLCAQLGLNCVYEMPTDPNEQASRPTNYDERLGAIEDTLRQLVAATYSNVHPTASASSGGTSAAQGTVFSTSESIEFISPTDYRTEASPRVDRIDGLASITDRENGLTRFFGPSSSIALLRTLSAAAAAAFHSEEMKRRMQNHRNMSQLVSRAPSPVQNSTEAARNLPRNGSVFVIPPHSQAMRLINLFFEDTGMLFPFVHKVSILSIYHAATNQSFLKVQKPSLALLNIVFGIATYMNDQSDILSGSELTVAQSEVLYERAKTLLNGVESQTSCLETVQCLLLMIQYRQGTQQSDETWTLLGQAVRIATMIGLHSRAAQSGLSLYEREIRKRTWYNCFVHDQILSMTFGRPPMISSHHMTLDAPLSRSLDSLLDFESTVPQTSSLNPDTVCFFIATINLYTIMSEILSALYNDNLDLDTSVPLGEKIQRTISIEQKLVEWRRCLPIALCRTPWLDQSSGTSDSTMFSSVFNKLSVMIHLRGLNARIVQHRAILETLLSYSVDASNYSGKSAVEDDLNIHYAERSLHEITDCAAEVIDVVWSLKTSPSVLGAWWFSGHYTFNAGLVLFGCLLVQLHLNKRIPEATQRPRDHFDETQVIGLLRRAVESIEITGKDTRTAKKMARTLNKISQASAALAHMQSCSLSSAGSSNLHVSEPLENLSNPNSLNDHQLPQAYVMMPSHVDQEQNLYDEASNRNFGAMNHFTFDDSIFAELELWSLPDPNIFAELGGFDPDLGNLMAG